MVTFISHNPAETEALGAQWGQSARDGWLLGLGGELGAGKTQLVRGLARGLGFAGRVQSPTFALINQYEGGRLPLFHLDLYRLNQREEILHAGLGEYLDHPTGVVVVEWVEKWLPEQFARWRMAPGTLSPAGGEGQGEGASELGGAVIETKGPLRLVWIEGLGETERRITYEDFGA